MFKKNKVIIVGAGFAGLGAAKNLVDKFDVTILEARERAGGRVHTDYSLGIPFDIGAFIIHGAKGNPMIPLAKQYNASLQSLKVGSAYIAEEKKILSESECDIISEQFEELIGCAQAFAYQQTSDVPLEQAFKTCRDINRFPALTQVNFDWRCLFLNLYTGADSKQLSARHWNEDETPYDNIHHLMMNGYQPIVDGLAKDLSIIFQCIVHRIDYQNKICQIHTNQGLFEANYVIVTFPLGVLKNNNIQFNPPLPKKKQNAIMQLGMGVLDKVALEFPHTFGPDNCRIFSCPTKQSKSVAWFLNFQPYFHRPILMGAVAGEVARQVELQSNDDFINEIMSTLENMFGSNVPRPIRMIRTRWDQDPFTFGSYSYIAHGSCGEDYDIMAESVDNKLFFAGEATNKQYPGTTHGAYLSGIREALKICELID